MTNFQKFKRRLRSHPGLSIASLYTVGGAAAGLNNPNSAGHELLYMGIGVCATGLVWIPVLVTAWKDRNIE